MRKPIRCHVCGYDLTGLDRAECPECGTGFVIGDEARALRDSLHRAQAGRCKVCGASVPAGSGKCPTCGCRVVRSQN